MTFLYYISIFPQNNVTDAIFRGYFTVDATTNLVTGFYALNNYQNILYPPTWNGDWLDPNTPRNSNAFPVDVHGIALTEYINYNGISFNKLINYNGPTNNTSLNYNLFNSWVWIADTNQPTENYQLNIITDIYPINEPQTQMPTPIPASIPTSIPISNTCFPLGTPILTDQGNIPIEHINIKYHTINNKKIISVTKTITTDKYLICFEKHSLGLNYPNEKTMMSRDHKLYYNGKYIEAYKFLDKFDNVNEVEYNNEILYNILMKKYDKIEVNNLICETLHPDNLIAKLYTSTLDINNKNNLIVMMNDSIINNDYNLYKKIIHFIDDDTTKMSNDINNDNSNYLLDDYKIDQKHKSKEEHKQQKYIIYRVSSNINLQNKLNSYVKTRQNTQETELGIIKKKQILNEIKEIKENKEQIEILRKEIKTILKHKKNNQKTMRFVLNKKNTTYKCIN